jgi:hypothetical protein
MVWRVAIVGGGRMGQHYMETYNAFADCRLVAVVDPNAERGRAVCKFHGVEASFTSLEDMLQSEARPDVVSIVTPGSYFRETVVALAGRVPAVQCEKPLGGPLAHADEMVAACESAGTIFAGGALSCALPRLHQAAGWLREGRYGKVIGASVHGWSSEILGAGNQHTSVLRLLTGDEIGSVMAWCDPVGGLHDAEGKAVDALDGAEHDTGAMEPTGRDSAHFNAIFTLKSGLSVPVFGFPKNDFLTDPKLASEHNPMGRVPVEGAGVRVWTDRGVQVYSPGPECQEECQLLWKGAAGEWEELEEPGWMTEPNAAQGHLGASIRSMLVSRRAS